MYNTIIWVSGFPKPNIDSIIISVDIFLDGGWDGKSINFTRVFSYDTAAQILQRFHLLGSEKCWKVKYFSRAWYFLYKVGKIILVWNCVIGKCSILFGIHIEKFEFVAY